MPTEAVQGLYSFLQLLFIVTFFTTSLTVTSNARGLRQGGKEETEVSYLTWCSLQYRRLRKHEFIPGVGKIPWGRAGNPLQYSCLENPMDRGAWQATVHGVTKRRIQLRQLSTQRGYIISQRLKDHPFVQSWSMSPTRIGFHGSFKIIIIINWFSCSFISRK